MKAKVKAKTGKHPFGKELKDLSNAYDKLFRKAEKAYPNNVNALASLVLGINATSGALLVDRINEKYSGGLTNGLSKGLRK